MGEKYSTPFRNVDNTSDEIIRFLFQNHRERGSALPGLVNNCK